FWRNTMGEGVTTGRLDLDNVGAEFTEQFRSPRTDCSNREIEDANTGEDSRHAHASWSASAGARPELHNREGFCQGLIATLTASPRTSRAARRNIAQYADQRFGTLTSAARTATQFISI